MGSIFLDVSSVVGIPSKTSWSSTAHVRTPFGEIVCALSVSGSEQAPSIGRKIVKQLQEFFPETEEESDQSFYQLWQSFSGFSDNVNFSGAAAWCRGKLTLVCTSGHAQVGLWHVGQRDHESAMAPKWLFDGEQPTGVLQGEMQQESVVLLATKSAGFVLPGLETLKTLNPDDVSSSLFSRFQSHSQSGEMAVATFAYASTPQKEDFIAQEPQEAESEKDEVPQSKPAPGHLISPEKIQAGVEQAQAETTQSLPSQKKFPAFQPKRIVENLKAMQGLRVVGVVVAVLFILGAMMGYRSWNVGKEYQQVIVPLEKLASEVRAIPEDQRFQRRSSTQSLLERLQATKITYSANIAKRDALVNEMQKTFTDVSGEKEIVNLPVFYDFRLIAADFLATRVSRDKEQSIFLDLSGKKAVSLNLTSKQNETLPLPETENLRDVVQNNGFLYFLGQDQLYRSRLNGAELAPLMALESMGEPTFLHGFGESLYVLDREKQQIWRVGTSDTTASSSGWVRSARGVDFSAVSSMTIDGSIWLGSNTGDIYKLTRGEREDFATQGLSDPFTSTILVSTVADGKKLIVVEPSKKRMVILNKETGEFLEQFTSEQLGAVTDLTLAEDESSVYLLAGSQVYRVEI